MNTLLTKFGAGLVSIAMAVSGLLGYHAPAQQSPTLGANQINYVGGKVYYLSGSGVSATDTTIPLVSFTQPVSGTPLQMADFGGVLYGTLESNNSAKKEFVSCTGVTQNANGTAAVTSCTRGLQFVSPYTATSTLRLSHSGGSTFVISNPPQLYNELAAKGNNEVITGSWSFPSPTTASSVATKGYADGKFAILATTTPQTFSGALTFSTASTFTNGGSSLVAPATSTDLVNKGYADGLALAGAPNASTTQKGIVQQATPAQIVSRTSSGSTGAPLFINAGDIDNVASSSIQIYFASTTNSALLIPNINVDQNDIVNIFATAYRSNLNGTDISNDIELFNGTATTTLSNGKESGGATVGGTASIVGYYLVPAGVTTIRAYTGIAGTADEVRLLVQVFKR